MGVEDAKVTETALHEAYKPLCDAEGKLRPGRLLFVFEGIGGNCRGLIQEACKECHIRAIVLA